MTTIISDVEENEKSIRPQTKITDIDETFSDSEGKEVNHSAPTLGKKSRTLHGEIDISIFHQIKNSSDYDLNKQKAMNGTCVKDEGKKNEVQTSEVQGNKQGIRHEAEVVVSSKTRSDRLDQLTDDLMPRGIHHEGGDDVKNLNTITSDEIKSDGENLNSIDTSSVCHPSKLANENSASTFQPNSLENHLMSPNASQQVLEDPTVKRNYDFYRKEPNCNVDNLALESENDMDDDISEFQNLFISENMKRESKSKGSIRNNLYDSENSCNASLDGPDFSLGSSKDLLSDFSEHDENYNKIEASRSTPGGITPVLNLEEGLWTEPNVKLTQQVDMTIKQPKNKLNPPPVNDLRHESSRYTQMQPTTHPQIQSSTLQQGISRNISARIQHIPAQMITNVPLSAAPPVSLGGSLGGRRKINLRLEEDAKSMAKRSFFFRRKSPSFKSLQSIEETGIDRGVLTVSWFEGTSTSELQEHVRNSVVRKLHLDASIQIADIRIIDRSEDPPQEIVLSPFIPDGSTFVLRFSTQTADKPSYFSISQEQNASGVSTPKSPSAAPSPYPSNADLKSLNAQLLSGKLNALSPKKRKGDGKGAINLLSNAEEVKDERYSVKTKIKKKKVDEADTASGTSDFHEEDIMGYNPEDQIEARLRQLADLLIADRKSRRAERRVREKRQVVFVIANYLGFFLALIALSAELSARAPKLLEWIEDHLENVQKCSTDQDALFECVSKGDFAGLVASFILWLSRSTATKRFFLFGFETPKKLWTVVYESFVTAVCWGTSYIVIRRGMNPDTRSGFVRKYWKDAVYGSLAGFNAAFMKQVLKNLIPQEAVEDVFQERQLKILSWLPSFH